METRIPYIEMNEAQRTLSYIYDSMEFAHASIAIGVQGEIKGDCTVNDVIEIESRICKIGRASCRERV